MNVNFGARVVEKARWKFLKLTKLQKLIQMKISFTYLIRKKHFSWILYFWLEVEVLNMKFKILVELQKHL